MKKLLFLILFFSFNIIEVMSNNIWFRTLNVENGLLHTDVTCFAQDMNGLIWLGTNGGLQSFDGYRLKSFDYYRWRNKVTLSHNRITSLAAQSTNLWVGTESGLLKFNILRGDYESVSFAANIQSLGTRTIRNVFLTGKNLLWVITEDCVYPLRISEDGNSLSLYGNTSKALFSLRNVTNIINQGKLVWICTPSHLLVERIAENRIEKLGDYGNHELTPGDLFSSMVIKGSQIYLRTSTGCVRYQIKPNGKLDLQHSERFDFHTLNGIIPIHTSGKMVMDNHNTLWCSSNVGLIEVSLAGGSAITAKLHTHMDNMQPSINSYFISSLFIDDYNNLWVGTWGNGLNYASLNKSMFNTISCHSESQSFIQGSFVRGIEEMSDGTLWILTQLDGLNLFRRGTGLIQHIDLSQFIGKGNVFRTMKLNQDKHIIYVGLINGLVAYNIQTNTLSYIIYKRPGSLVEKNADITKMEYDGNGYLWVSTWNAGIFCFKDNHGDLSLEKHIGIHDGLKSECVPYLYYDREKNNMFACTRNGLSRFILNRNGLGIKKVLSYSANANHPKSITNNFIVCIDKQNDSTYWIGTLGGGLNRLSIFDERNNDYSATSYMVPDGMMSNDAEVVLVDRQQNVWVGGTGIVKLDTHTGVISKYDHYDGLHGSIIKYGASLKGSDGTFYMGGIDGLTFFNPSLVREDKENFKLYLSNLYVHGKIINVGDTINGETLLPEIINHLDEISLHHDQNDFSIEFSLLGYRLSNKIKYRYRLMGYEKDWHVVPVTDHRAYYANLDYSTYTFQLQYSTDNGRTWNSPGKQLMVKVLPPWWLSTWMKVVYFLLLLALVRLVFYIYKQQLSMNHKIAMQELEKAKNEENHQLKLQFFMNVSHEFKTPLTLILSSIENISSHQAKGVSDIGKVKEYFEVITRNASRLLRMINELVDFRKSDLNIAQLNLAEDNIEDYLSHTVEEFSAWALRKHIQLKYQKGEPIVMRFDPEKIATILANLLSNAIKNTPSGGNVEISIESGKNLKVSSKYPNEYLVGKTIYDDSVCIIKIADTGIGISADSINKIYDRFYQIKDYANKHIGAGIGLAVVKNHILLHGGNIIVSSEKDKGTEFIITLPMNMDMPLSQEEPGIDRHLISEHIVDDEMYDDLEDEADPQIDNSLQTLLIVEDNKELRTSLRKHFSSRYNVITAENGKIGLEKCTNFYPDVVISDVMMPLMDGTEMCNAIRNQLSIAYTPIILLTVKDAVENQIEGYEAGADLYLPKPFSMRILELNVERLLAQKLRLMQTVNVGDGSSDEARLIETDSSSETEMTREDLKNAKEQDFMKDLQAFMDQNISNSDLTVEEICRHLGVGRTRLYSMVKSISGQSLGDYIRDMRLNKAAYLLRHTDRNITETMYATGFNTNSHFTKVFKAKFGQTPSDFAKSSTKS